MIRVLKNIWWFFKKNYHKYILILILSSIISYLLLIPPKIIGDFVELVDTKDITRDKIITLAITNIVIVVLIYGSAFFKRVFQMRLGLNLNFELRKKFLRKILDEDQPFFEEYPVGDLIARTTGDINFVQRVSVDVILSLVSQIITIGLTVYNILVLSPKLTLLSLTPLPFMWMMIIILRPLIRNNWRRVRAKVSLMNNSILESATNVRTIRSNAIEDQNFETLKAHADDVYNTEKQNLKVNSLFGPLFQSINSISIVIALWVGGTEVIKGSMSLADLVQFNLYLAMLIWPLAEIGMTFTTFQQSHVSLDRLNEIYNSYVYMQDVPNAKDVNEFKSLEFKDFNFKYTKSANNNLSNITFKLNKGETLGIVGKTASGKSTLIKQLLRQYPIDSNTLYVNDLPIDRYTIKSIREMISYVSQEHTLFSRSVYDNILLGSVEEKTQDEVIDAIKKADFLKDIPYLNDGLDTIVGEYGVTLSGGQKQRLSIARAFLKDSDILILDDSLSAVDGNTEASIIESIKKYRKNKTNIIIAHRLSAVKHADKIIVLENGHIVEFGTHQELINKDGWYQKQYHAQELNVKGGDNNE